MKREDILVGDVSISYEEATETLQAIRTGRVDAVVVNASNGHTVVTFREPDRMYRGLVEAMGEGAALVTRDGVIGYHNPRFAALATGPGAAPVRGRLLRELVAADARVPVDAMLERARVGPARIEVAMISAEGGTVPVQLTASVASVSDLEVLCVVATDLGEQHVQAELYREALVGMEARERLLSIAGHELRAPLQALLFEIDVLLARDPTSDQLGAIHRQARQIASLVGNLLDVGLVGSDQLTLAIDDVDLAEVARTTVERSDDLARSSSPVTLELAPARGQWDRLRLEQVATNLISNAAKYGLGKPIRVVVDGDERTARLTIEDRGIGVAPEAVPRLFRPFERIGSVKTATGLGLGLYITSQIVKAHGGVVRVDSDPGVGSRFVVELPCQRAVT